MFLWKFSLTSYHSPNLGFAWFLNTHCCLKKWSNCWFLVQQYIFVEQHFCIYQYDDQILIYSYSASWFFCQKYQELTIWAKKGKYIPLTKCHSTAQILDVIFIKRFDKFYFYLNGVHKISFNSSGVHKISFLFILGGGGSTRFHFYLFGGLQDFISVYMGKFEISFLLV